MKFLKHKAEIKVPKNKDVKDYLFTSSVQASGAVRYDAESRLIETQNNIENVIFGIDFINANGIDTETDKENKMLVNEVVKSLSHDFKIVDMNVIKNGLNRSIEELEEILKSSNVSSKRKEKIEDRLSVMKFYNNEKYIKTFIFISKEDIDIFCKLATTVFNIERLSEKKTLKILSALNNDME